MYLTPYDKAKIKKLNTYSMSSNLSLLTEFMESEHDCVRVEGWQHKDAYSCVRALGTSAKRYHMYGVKVISREGEVYLIKTKDK